MKKLTILCDADDTIQDLSTHWLEELNKKYNYCVRKEDMKSWDMTKAFPELTCEEVLAPLYKDEFWNKVTPIRGSSYYLNKLISDGHKIMIVTASNKETFDAKTKKLIEMFPFLNKEQIIREDNKQKIKGDILIDDGVHNLINGEYMKFLYHQPTNSNFNEKEYDILRVHSWKEIYEKISNMIA